MVELMSERVRELTLGVLSRDVHEDGRIGVDLEDEAVGRRFENGIDGGPKVGAFREVGQRNATGLRRVESAPPFDTVSKPIDA